ncbi:fatty acid synthase-like [Copidosoma floridanum]|uniref:fatty acid synthase-like n=1 Tax=Copidosoma floridanum TaxID=29053 RepID=UPI0006C95E1C|nr:fatty acid synthase-like [Copidosoma floridanum]
MLEQQIICNDYYNVIPNIDKSDTLLSTSLRVILQVVLENIFSPKIQEIEIVKSNNLSDLNTLQNAMYNTPEAAFFKTKIISYENTKFNKILTIVVDDVRNYDLQKLSHCIENNRFLLLIVNSNRTDLFKNFVESIGLKIVLMRKHANNDLLLFRKRQSLDLSKILYESGDITQIVTEIKHQNISADSARIIVIIESKNMKYVTSCIHYITKEINVEKIRIFISQNLNKLKKSELENLCKRQLETDLFINVLTKNNVWATLRRTKISVDSKSSDHWIAHQESSNDPHNFTWTESLNRKKTRNLIQVKFSALNKQDILIAEGLFFSDISEKVAKKKIVPKTIGLEFSGTDFEENRIMGISNGNSMSNFINIDSDWTWQVPEFWSLEDAATVPLAYIIAYTVLYIKTQVKAKEKILIINSCDGPGLAILNLALHKSCDVFVTYQTKKEKEVLTAIAPHLLNNRLFNLSENSIPDNIFLATMGEGVDVIICNDCKIRTMVELFSVIKRKARVVIINDLSDNVIFENIGMEVFLKEIKLCSVIPRKVASYGLEVRKLLKKLLHDGIKQGCVKPLPRTVYNREFLKEAFTACAKNNNVKKILVKVQSDEQIKDVPVIKPRFHGLQSKTYLVIEGLTKFGLEFVDWLVTRGARHFIITSSEENNSGYQHLRMKVWKSYGVEITLHEKFIPTKESICLVFKEACSIGSIDAIFDLQRCIQLNKAEISPFTDLSTKYLDEMSRSFCHSLRLFVICSITENKGNLALIKNWVPLDIGGLENKFIEKLLEQRKRDSLPGLFICWGLVDSTKKYIKNPSSTPILPPVTKYLQNIDDFLYAMESQVQVLCTVPHTKEVCKYVDDAVSFDATRKSAEEFTTSLYEQHGACVDSLTMYV